MKLTANQIKLITKIFEWTQHEGVEGTYPSGFMTHRVYDELDDAPLWARVECTTDWALLPFEPAQRGGILNGAVRKGLVEVEPCGVTVHWEDDQWGRPQREVCHPYCYVTQKGYDAWRKVVDEKIALSFE